MDYKILINKIVVGSLITLFLLMSYKLIFFYVPFLIAYIISLLIEPLIKMLTKKTSLTRKTSSILVLVIIFTILIFIISLSIVKLISETTNLLEGINSYLEKAINLFNKFDLNKLNLSKEVISIFEKSVSEFFNTLVENIKNVLSSILNYITSIPNLFINFIITVLATYFITSDKFYILDRMEHHLSKKMVGKIITHAGEIISTLGKYLKAEIILSLITFLIVLTGLNIFYLVGLKVEYPILMALIIGFVDALPILGAGSIMIPWSIILFLSNNNSLAIAIFGLYIFTLVAKQLLEPKIVSNNIGIHPIFTLFAMYTGYKIIGIAGLIIGPIILIILKNIFSDVIDKGIVNSIVDI